MRGKETHSPRGHPRACRVRIKPALAAERALCRGANMSNSAAPQTRQSAFVCTVGQPEEYIHSEPSNLEHDDEPPRTC